MTDLETTIADAGSAITSLLENDDESDLQDRIADTVGDGIDALEGDDRSKSDAIANDLDNVVRLLEETETMLRSIDFSAIPDAIDEDELLEAIEMGEIPAALQGEEDEEVVKLRQIVKAVNVLKLFQTADISELWNATQEFDEATDELTDEDDGDDGIIDGVTESITGEDDGEEDGVFGTEDDELLETDVVDVLEMGSREALSEFDPQENNMKQYEEIIQAQAMEGVDSFRDALLKTHGKFERLVEINREKTRQTDRTPNSRNPTAVSTLVIDRPELRSPENYATMPRQVRHSSAPNRTHIYGRRFELERKRRGYDDE
ncbi:hypothetical protein OB919_16235 [Halobacteria archaeon AArc-curdl1]|uniref:Uncharacterized protein n=1 Tax=Natronosalvus hydrolyticus TaxID=2979988 RepID=A0AAP2ZCU9_9EURY|nr:hypothetical protein [Halobacteria archaeon AArc-curdl1]